MPKYLVSVSLLWSPIFALAETKMHGPTVEMELQDLERQLISAVGEAECTTTADCYILSVGRKPCGGPDYYLAYSRTSGEDELNRLSDKYATLAAKLEKDDPVVGTCIALTKPKVSCSDAGVCQVSEEQTAEAPARVQSDLTVDTVSIRRNDAIRGLAIEVTVKNLGSAAGTFSALHFIASDTPLGVWSERAVSIPPGGVRVITANLELSVEANRLTGKIPIEVALELGDDRMEEQMDNNRSLADFDFGKKAPPRLAH